MENINTIPINIQTDFVKQDTKTQTNIIENSAVATFYLGLFKSKVSTANKSTKGLHNNRYANIENIVKAIKGAYRCLGNNTTVLYQVTFPEVTDLKINVLLEVECIHYENGVIHSIKKSLEETFSSSKPIFNNEKMHLLQQFGSVRTYYTRYMLRSFFLNAFDSSDDLDNEDHNKKQLISSKENNDKEENRLRKVGAYVSQKQQELKINEKELEEKTIEFRKEKEEFQKKQIEFEETPKQIEHSEEELLLMNEFEVSKEDLNKFKEAEIGNEIEHLLQATVVFLPNIEIVLKKDLLITLKTYDSSMYEYYMLKKLPIIHGVLTKVLINSKLKISDKFTRILDTLKLIKNNKK
jgi:hypothetical protein